MCVQYNSNHAASIARQIDRYRFAPAVRAKSGDNLGALMTNSTFAAENHQMLAWGPVSLSKTLVDALNLFLVVPRNERSDTEWHLRCMAGQATTVFFKGTRTSDLFRLTASKIAADAYEDLRDQKEVSVVKPAFVVKLRGQALSIRESLPAASYLPSPANTKEFRKGLDSLCRWTPSVSAPTSKSGDVCARRFTLALAQQFASAFVEIPVEYVHYLVTLGWPNRSPSATRRVLTLVVTNRLKQEAESLRLAESLAQGASIRAIGAASSSRHVMSESESQMVEILQGEAERIRQGKRRFSTDGARLQALRDIAQSLDDKVFANEFTELIDGQLQDFSFGRK